MVRKNLEHRTITQPVPTGIDINVERTSEEKRTDSYLDA